MQLLAIIFNEQQRKRETYRSGQVILDKQLRYQSRESFVEVRRREEGTNMKFLVCGVGIGKERHAVNVFSILRVSREPEKHGHPYGGF